MTSVGKRPFTYIDICKHEKVSIFYLSTSSPKDACEYAASPNTKRSFKDELYPPKWQQQQQPKNERNTLYPFFVVFKLPFKDKSFSIWKGKKFFFLSLSLAFQSNVRQNEEEEDG